MNMPNITESPKENWITWDELVEDPSTPWAHTLKQKISAAGKDAKTSSNGTKNITLQNLDMSVLFLANEENNAEMELLFPTMPKHKLSNVQKLLAEEKVKYDRNLDKSGSKHPENSEILPDPMQRLLSLTEMVERVGCSRTTFYRNLDSFLKTARGAAADADGNVMVSFGNTVVPMVRGHHGSHGSERMTLQTFHRIFLPVYARSLLPEQIQALVVISPAHEAVINTAPPTRSSLNSDGTAEDPSWVSKMAAASSKATIAQNGQGIAS